MPETLATMAALTVLRAVAAPAVTQVAKTLKTTSDKVQARFLNAFKGHLERTFDKCANVRTIFSDGKYIPLSSIYVNLRLASESKICRDEDVVINKDSMGNVVVIGTGGAGKTMLMRHLALMIYEKPSGSIPLFIELRNLPEHNPDDFYKAIFNMVTPERQHREYNIFLEGLRAGIFVLLLDGLDEIGPSQREKVFKSIQRIPLDFPDVRVIASTRPEIDVRPWENFESYKVVGLNLDQAKLLIKKIDYPEALKNQFFELLDTEFYNKHKTFLSVPLLCTLMLITFNEYHEVPSRVTVFYEQAFETLFRRHDTGKEGFFKRTFASNLSSDRFRQIFSAFCYRTLAFNQVSFTDQALRGHLQKASAATEIEVNIDDYASDLVSAVCMLMRDGLNLHFIHRSFQDYFAALYILRYRGPDVYEVYDRVMSDMFVSNIVEMAADIDLQTLEREWALPTVLKIDKQIKSKRKDARVKFLIENLFYDIKVSGLPPSKITGWSWTSNKKFMKPLLNLSKIYNSRSDIGPEAFRGDLAPKGRSICELSKEGIRLPTEISDICAAGGHPFDDDSIEVPVEGMPFEWIKHTLVYGRAEKVIEGISGLRSELEGKIQNRDSISVLD